VCVCVYIYTYILCMCTAHRAYSITPAFELLKIIANVYIRRVDGPVASCVSVHLRRFLYPRRNDGAIAFERGLNAIPTALVAARTQSKVYSRIIITHYVVLLIIIIAICHRSVISPPELLHWYYNIYNWYTYQRVHY